MGFAEGYKQGKVITLLVAAALGMVVVLLLGYGVCAPSEPEVGDTIECLFTSRDIARGEAASMEILEYGKATVDSPSFSCVKNIILIKGDKFVEDVPANAVVTFAMVKKPEADFEP